MLSRCPSVRGAVQGLTEGFWRGPLRTSSTGWGVSASCPSCSRRLRSREQALAPHGPVAPRPLPGRQRAGASPLQEARARACFKGVPPFRVGWPLRNVSYQDGSHKAVTLQIKT